MVGGAILHTSGWGLNFRYAEFLTAFSKLAYEIEIVGLKHPKELKIYSPYEDNVRGYIYGKKNVVTLIRPSIGLQNVFISEQSIKGVSISYYFNLGPSFAIAKPVYLNIIEEAETFSSVNIVTKKYDPEEHTVDNIYGRASYFEGVNEMKLYPGIFAKFGFQFEYANSMDIVKALEAGIAADIYFKEVQIMALTENKAIYLNLYLNLLFGKRKQY